MKHLLSRKDFNRILSIIVLVVISVALIAGILGYVVGIGAHEENWKFYLASGIIFLTGGAVVIFLSLQLFFAIYRSKNQLSWQAFHDSLTGLVNRNQLEKNLDYIIASCLRSGEKFAIFFIDIDFLKKINDTLGHDAGDQLIRTMGERLKQSVRKTDVAARLGGDEFILVVNGADNTSIAAIFAEKIINRVIEPVKIHQHEVIVTASIGISFFPQDGNDYNTLIKSADLALYKAKQDGRNNYKFCTPAMNEEILQKLLFRGALQTALDKQEFYLVFQPKKNINTNQVIGFEALLRWESETYGNVPPNRIIHLTEEMGLIYQLGDWILRNAIIQASRWIREHSLRFPVSVNISARHFMQNTFVTSVMNALYDVNFPRNFLEIEISESLIMQNPEYSLNVIRQLKKAGVRISIDNFGTGYSSINYLQKFAIDRIKIDRKFIMHLDKRSDEYMLVQAIIGLSHSLNVAVLAEGVENKVQYDALIKLGCDEVQGYYVSHPLKTDAIPAYIEKMATSVSAAE